MSDLNKSDVGCRMSTSRMSDFTSRMLDFIKSDVYKSDVYKSDFNKPYVGFLQVGCPMSDFNKPDVGFLQVGCRMSDF